MTGGARARRGTRRGAAFRGAAVGRCPPTGAAAWPCRPTDPQVSACGGAEARARAAGAVTVSLDDGVTAYVAAGDEGPV
ncbi:hypothetical protein AB8A21_38270, partial [Streptomyces sp. BF23-18]